MVLAVMLDSLTRSLRIGRWRGRPAIHWTLGGFFLLLLAYFGSKFALEILLKRG